MAEGPTRPFPKLQSCGTWFGRRLSTFRKNLVSHYSLMPWNTETAG